MIGRRAILVLVVAAAVLTAGCVHDGSTDGGAPANDTANASEPLAYPPGVNGSGIQNLSALFAAHVAARGDAYRENESEFVVRGNGSQGVVRDTHLGPNGSVYVHAVQYVDGEPVAVQEVWDAPGDQSRLARIAEPGAAPLEGSFRREYRGANRSNYYPDRIRDARTVLRSYLPDADQHVEQTARDGRRLWNVTVDPSGPTRFTLLVAPDGLIVSFALDERGSAWRIVTEPLDRLEEPVWLEAARERAPPPDGPFGGSGGNGSNATDASGDDLA